jgi:shikimate kinase
MSRNLCLAGMMGSGKTTVGRLVAERLGRRFVDTDAELARWTGRDPGSLLVEEGEERFRDLEQRVVAELSGHIDLVIALGGGALLRDDNARALALTSATVLLDAPPEVLAERVGRDGTLRPLLGDAAAGEALVERLRVIADDRDERYRAIADGVVDASGTPDEVTTAVVDWAVAALDVLTPSEHEQVAT